MRKIFLIIILFFNVLCLSADDKNSSTKLWSIANDSYNNGDYKTAIEIYSKIGDEVGVSASLYYNIGNCYFKENNLAKAILYYNRAKKLDPSNEDIEHNLAVSNALTTNKIKEIPKFFLYSWLESAANILGSDGWAQLSIITLAVLLSMLIAFLLSKKSNSRKTTFTIAVIALVLTLLSSIASTYHHSLHMSQEDAIVMKNAVAVKSSPDNSGKDIFVLNEGVKVQIKEQLGKWSKITIASGDSGWLETSNIEVI